MEITSKYNEIFITSFALKIRKFFLFKKRFKIMLCLYSLNRQAFTKYFYSYIKNQ